MPAIIKRYSNRKLYDTDQNCYISLDEIATLVRHGEEVSIIDNDTGEDLTALTLAQIIMEQEKKLSGFLPGDLLAGLVEAGGKTVESVRRSLAGPLALRRWMDEELERRIDLLVAKKDLTRLEGNHLLEKLTRAGKRMEKVTQAQQALERYLEVYNIPTHQSFVELSEQIDQLAERIEALQLHD